MRLENYGVRKGCDANFVVLKATNKIDAIRLRAHRVAVALGGRIVSRSAPVSHELATAQGTAVLNETDMAVGSS